MHGDAIARIRRVLERYDLDPIALGLPPRPGDEAPCEFADSSGSEHPLLDFGDARDGSFFPGLKVASVKSAAPFAPGKGRPLERLFRASWDPRCSFGGRPVRRAPDVSQSAEGEQSWLSNSAREWRHGPQRILQAQPYVVLALPGSKENRTGQTPCCTVTSNADRRTLVALG